MNRQEVTSSSQTSSKYSQCYFHHFGLIVTGKGERDHLPKLFGSLIKTGICNFAVIKFTGQRGPIISRNRKLRMVGSGKIIPDRDMNDIGLPARGYLGSSLCHFVILVDDLEPDRKNQAQQVSIDIEWH